MTATATVEAQTLPLPYSVIQLTRPHFKTLYTPDGERLSGMEPPLLCLLQTAVGSSVGGSVGSLGQSAGSPLNLKALALQSKISEAACMGLWGTKRVPMAEDFPVALTTLVEDWARAEQTKPMAGKLWSDMEGWAQEIREMLNPPKRHPLRGYACPVCGSQWKASEVDGELARTEALVAELDTANGVPFIECLCCAAEWHGGEIHNLKAALNFGSAGVG